MSTGEFDEHAEQFSHELRMDEASLASEAQVLGALQQQGIFIDMDGYLRIEDKAAALRNAKEDLENEMEAVAKDRPEVDDMEQLAPGVFADRSEAGAKYQKLEDHKHHMERQIKIVSFAEAIAICITEYDDEDDLGEYPVVSADYDQLPEGMEAQDSATEVYPYDRQLLETDDFVLHRTIAEIPNEYHLMLDDRRALLAAIESLIGTERYQQLIHDLFRTDRPERPTAPNIIHI